MKELSDVNSIYCDGFTIWQMLVVGGAMLAIGVTLGICIESLADYERGKP